MEIAMMLEPQTSRSALVALAGLLLLAGACDGQDPMEDGGSDTMGMSLCEVEDRADDFTIGLSKSGMQLDLEIAEAVPADPIRGDNTWTVMITDAQGSPAEGLTIDAKPWMPDHGHGSSVEEQVTEMGGGRYMLDPLNLFMAGFWQVTIEITDADGTTDEVMIGVCVE
jgi:hypothetical protein